MLQPPRLSAWNEQYNLNYAHTDFGDVDVAIDLREVEGVKTIKRRATIPGVSDENGPHCEPAKKQWCAYMRTCLGFEYFLADRTNESRGRTWGDVRNSAEAGESLLCEKIMELWQEVKGD